VIFAFLFESLGQGERKRDLLQSTHISLWEHSSHARLIGRGIPGVSLVSR